MAKVVLLIEREYTDCWSKMFQNPENLTVQNIFKATVKKGPDIDKLLQYLDFTREFSGILKEVVETFLETRIRQLLPETILSSEFFAEILSGGMKRVCVNLDEDAAWDYIAQMLKNAQGFDGGERLELDTLNSPMSYAMIAYIHFGLGDYINALTIARLAFDEKNVSHLLDKLEANDTRATASLIKTTGILIEILLQKAVARKKALEYEFSA